MKVRGHRVELGEIEHRLRGHELVEDAVVAARTGPDGQTYLCGYVVAVEPVSEDVLRGHLRAPARLHGSHATSSPDAASR